MANGQQKAKQNLNSFQTWVATQTDEDFKQIIFRGQLNRGEIAKAVGCGKSALNQNPELKNALAELEGMLRKRQILPPLTLAAKKSVGTAKQYDQTASRKLNNSLRLSQLEQENIELKAQLSELKQQHENFQELSETLFEMGLMSR